MELKISTAGVEPSASIELLNFFNQLFNIQFYSYYNM
jgi:hypothetical protein